MPITALAAENSCVFFAPQSMNEANEIIVPIYTKNLPQDNDGLCGCEFQFAYNTEQFTLKTDESGRPLLGTNETMLVQDTDIIEASVNGDIVSVSYVDFSGENNVVLRDGGDIAWTVRGATDRCSTSRLFRKIPMRCGTQTIIILYGFLREV